MEPNGDVTFRADGHGGRRRRREMARDFRARFVSTYSAGTQGRREVRRGHRGRARRTASGGCCDWTHELPQIIVDGEILGGLNGLRTADNNGTFASPGVLGGRDSATLVGGETISVVASHHDNEPGYVPWER